MVEVWVVDFVDFSVQCGQLFYGSFEGGQYVWLVVFVVVQLLNYVDLYVMQIFDCVGFSGVYYVGYFGVD